MNMLVPSPSPRQIVVMPPMHVVRIDYEDCIIPEAVFSIEPEGDE